MNLKSITGRSFLMAALIALPAASFAASGSAAGYAPEQQLKKDLEYAANDASDHASLLESATFSSSVSWEVHAQKLQALKNDVNEISRIVSRLEEMRPSLIAADADNLDRFQVLVKELAANATSAIQFLNADQQNFWRPAYRKNISSLVNESSQLATLAGRALRAK